MLFSDLQKKMLSLMVELDELLRAHDIKYMLYCGSQLGADRHHGMIPWDDDIDIMMSLDNYDKFIEVARTSLPEGRTVNALELSTEYPLCYARYVDTTTTALQKHTIFGGCDPGVKIDVFFCVPTSGNEKKAKQHQLEILAFNELIIDNITMIYRRPEEFFPVYENEKKLFNKLGREEYIRKRLPQLKYKYVSRFRKPEKYIFFSGMAGNSHFFDASEITNAKEVDFEGHKVFAAVNGPYYDIESYDESWYQIPRNISKPHHTWAADVNTPFSKHLEVIGNYFDLDKVHEIQRKRKELKLLEQVRFKDAIIQRARLKNLATGMSVEKRYFESRDKLSLPERYEVFSPYYVRQLDRENRWYGLEIPMADEVLEAALRCLAEMGDFAKVLNILDILGDRKISCRDELMKQVKLSRQLIYSIYVYPSELQAVSKLVEKSGDVINLSVPEARGRILLSRMRASDDNAERASFAREIIEGANSSMEIYGDRSELRILKAFAVQELEKLGEWQGETSSDELFDMDPDNIVNGFILQEILDEGYNILKTDADEDSEDEGDVSAGSQVIHRYVEASEYSAIKQELSDKGLDFAVKGKDEKEHIVLYDRSFLASTFAAVFGKKTDNMCGRTIWHKCGQGEQRTELKEVPIFADNITPEEFLDRAKKEGFFSSKELEVYNEYKDWLKNEFSEINKEFNQFGREFLQYMSKSEVKQ